ncbi:hypothetical protein PCE1_000629 [Barthelona sp. PCE]
MTTQLNINGSDDPSYRYKMPRVSIESFGREGNVRTRFKNIIEVARAIKVEPDFIAWFLGIDLGAQVRFTAKDNECLLRGSQDLDEMQQSVFNFIQNFVLCPSCGLPEITLSKKKKTVYCDCGACGFYNPLFGDYNIPTTASDRIISRMLVKLPTTTLVDEQIETTIELDQDEMLTQSILEQYAEELRADVREGRKAEEVLLGLQNFGVSYGIREEQLVSLLWMVCVHDEYPLQMLATTHTYLKAFAQSSMQEMLLLKMLTRYTNIFESTLKLTSHILLALYSTFEIVDLDVMIKWYDAAPESPDRVSAKKLIEHLKGMDEDEDEYDSYDEYDEYDTEEEDA